MVQEINEKIVDIYSPTKERPYRRFSLNGLFRAIDLLIISPTLKHHFWPGTLTWDRDNFYLSWWYGQPTKIGETRSHNGFNVIALNEKGEEILGKYLDEIVSWYTVDEIRIPIEKSII